MSKLNEKLCLICNHPPCPYCLNWCDIISNQDKENGPDICCDGLCVYKEELNDENNSTRLRQPSKP